MANQHDTETVSSTTKGIDRKMLIVNLASMPFAAMLGLGMYGKFGAQGEAFVAILNKPNVVTALIALGALGTVATGLAVVRLAKRKGRVQQEGLG